MNKTSASINPAFGILAVFILFTLMHIMTPSPANAGEWSHDYQVLYTLGDNDTRAEARSIALDKLRLLAAADAGKYIQGDERLENGKYSESIHMAAATIVSVSDIEESVSVNNAGQTVLHISASATVDDAELKKRIAILQKDQSKMKRLADLERKVNALIAKLTAIAPNNSRNLARIVSERNAIIENMHTAFHEARLVFTKGFLIKNIGKTERMIQANIAYLHQKIIDPLMENANITVNAGQIVYDEGKGENRYAFPVIVKMDSTIDESAGKFNKLDEFVPFNPDIGVYFKVTRHPHSSFEEAYYKGKKLFSIEPVLRDYNKETPLPISQNIIDRFAAEKCLSIDVSLSGIDKHLFVAVSTIHKSDRVTRRVEKINVISKLEKNVIFHLTRNEAESVSGVEAHLRRMLCHENNKQGTGWVHFFNMKTTADYKRWHDEVVDYSDN